MDLLSRASTTVMAVDSRSLLLPKASSLCLMATPLPPCHQNLASTEIRKPLCITPALHGCSGPFYFSRSLAPGHLTTSRLENEGSSCFIARQDRHMHSALNTTLVSGIRIRSCRSGYSSKYRAFRALRCTPFRTNRPNCRTVKWWQHRLFLNAAENSGLNPPEDESYWEKPEGKEKLKEIEELKELIAEAEKLQSKGDERPIEMAGGSSSEESAEEQVQKLREELAKRAREQTERRKEAEKMFQIGQQAYGKGMYDKSVEFFEAALTNIPDVSNLGGEIQIWLAMAYEAHNRHSDCIALYKRLEKSHPNKFIRRQAKDLRYILEAPKLKISKEEMVTIPLIDQNNDSDSRTWSQMYKERRRKNIAKQIPQTRDYLADWLVWSPPRWERNPYFWVAVTIWLTLVGISLIFQD